MKKVTLIAALFVGAVSFAQNIVIDRMADHNSGLISTKGSDDTGVYCADFFTLDAETAFGELTIYGLNSNGGSIATYLTGFSIYIFADAGGMPLGDPEEGLDAIIALKELDSSLYSLVEDGQRSQFIVNVTAANGGDQVKLPAGDYWISVFPTVLGTPAGDGRWNWFGSASSFPLHEPVLIDPDDLFGLGVFTWTNIASLIGESFPSFAWTLKDEVLSVGANVADLVSVYPNPTTDILNINVPASVELINVSMFDVLGKQVNVSNSNGVVNTSSLSNGVYMLRIQTSAGDLIQKIVKQ